MHIRVSEDLKERLEKAAKEKGRSMNAEIVQRLDGASHDAKEFINFLKDEAEELEAQIPSIKWELDQAHKQLGEMIAALTETDTPITDDKIALLQSQTRFYRAKLEDAESRLRRIKRVIG